MALCTHRPSLLLIEAVGEAARGTSQAGNCQRCPDRIRICCLRESKSRNKVSVGRKVRLPERKLAAKRSNTAKLRGTLQKRPAVRAERETIRTSDRHKAELID